MTTFGKYQVLDLIGRGGFGSVFRAYDPALKRHVAIKTCTLDLEVRERFVQEAEIAAGLKHPSIVTIYDFWEFNGEPYLVQEYLPGHGLDELISARTPADLATRVAYLSQIADGLAYAHSHGIVHRDVKPANIRVLDDNTIRIVDFGIAKVLEAEHSITRTGLLIGTAGYLAPEQIRGERIDHRVDIFAFGVLAYTLLTFTKPFRAQDVTAQCYQILHEEPPPIGDVAPDCPPRLVEIINRCLRKDRDARYATLQDVQLELNMIRADLLRRGETQRPREYTVTSAVAFDGRRPVRTTLKSIALFLMRKPSKWMLGSATLVALLAVSSLALRPSWLPRIQRNDRPPGSLAPVDTHPSAEQNTVPAATQPLSTGTPTVEVATPLVPSSPPRAAASQRIPDTQLDTLRGRTPSADVANAAPLANTNAKAAKDAAGATQAGPMRILVLLRGAEEGLPSAGAALTGTLVEEQLDVVAQEVSTSIVADVQSAATVFAGQLPEITRLARVHGAELVLVAELRAESAPSVGPFYTGSATLVMRTYDVSASRLLAIESFSVGAAGVPGKLASTPHAALTEAATEVGRLAARATVNRAGR